MNIEKVRQYALSLPGAAEEPHHALSSFRVMGKIFATFPPGGQYLHVFVDEATREQALAVAPLAFEKPFWGSRVAGLRVLLSAARSSAVQELLRGAWARKAPKKLLAAFASRAKT